MAHLIIGGYKWVSVKYEIPIAWCLVVDPNSTKSKGGDRTKCDKCGQMITGGRRRLNRHKREHHFL